jgi:hypothetical protein
MYGTKITMKTINGKHIVTHRGTVHVFDSLGEAWDYITLTHFINFRLGRKTV